MATAFLQAAGLKAADTGWRLRNSWAYRGLEAWKLRNHWFYSGLGPPRTGRYKGVAGSGDGFGRRGGDYRGGRARSLVTSD